MEEEIDIMIDDNLHTIDSLKDVGINTIWFNSLSGGINNWLEVYKYIKSL